MYNHSGIPHLIETHLWIPWDEFIIFHFSNWVTINLLLLDPEKETFFSIKFNYQLLKAEKLFLSFCKLICDKKYSIENMIKLSYMMARNA